MNEVEPNKADIQEPTTVFTFEGSICKIIVRPEDSEDSPSVTFTAHEDVIRAKSKFFDAALSKSWQEAKTGKVNLPDADPDIVRRYLQCAYGGVLVTSDDSADAPDKATMKEEYPLLAQLYLFGEYLQDSTFTHIVLDRLIVRMCGPGLDGMHWYPNENTITKIYEGTVGGDAARRVLVACWASEGHEEWLKGKLDCFPKEFLRDLAMELYKPENERRGFSRANVYGLRKKYATTEQ